MKKRILSLLLCLAMVISMLPVLDLTVPVKATTSYQYNIVDRADYLYNITWIAQKTVYGWCGNYTFKAGTAYRIPYGQPINSGAYIGYGVSVDSFISAAKNAGSVFYSSRSSYSNTNSVYYATDCSAFVSWCWGIDRKTTYSIPLTSGVTYLGMATTANTSLLQLGDCLNSNSVGHVVLVTDLTYDSSGNLTQIEITEQTPPQLKRSYYTPAQLGSYYGGAYGIYRYSGAVPAAPNTVTSKYYPSCDSSFTSLYPAMESIGVSCDWTLHCEIAEANGITGFTGTAAQNTQLLDLLKEGKLINPRYVEVTYYPSCDSSFTSLYPALESLGIDCDWDLHCRIAAVNGITNFTGTVEQNTQLLDLLKAGKLVNPDGGTSSGGTSGGTGSFVNGYDNGYPGGMPGDGKIYAHGLDVSEWQGSSLDFKAIKNAGYDFVILRAGTSYGKDKCFETYYTNARAAGLDIGTYYYTYATSVSAAQTDANNMLSWISGKTFEYPVYFDYEDSCQDGLSSTTAKNICLTFCDAMADAGYLAGVYTGYYKSTQLPMSAICAKYEVWIANYWDYGYESLSPSYSTKYGMYQYTDRNYVGSKGPFDGDVVFKDYPSIVKQYGFNGYGNPNAYLDQCTVYPSHCKVTTTKSTPLNTLPCSASTHGSRTLVTAEADQTYTAQALYMNTSGNYWYQVTLDTGETAYLYGGHASFQEALGTDITLTGADLPGNILEGDSFTVNGKATATLNRLDQVSVGVYSGSGLLGTVVIEGTAAASNNTCDLAGSEAALDFSTLEDGQYFYSITAKYSGYYATAAKEATTYSAEASLAHATFTVEPNLTYVEQCTFYPAHCQVTTSEATAVNSLPCDSGANKSAQLLALAANVTVTATGLYQNPDGELWYLVTLDTGEIGYLFAGHSTYVQDLDTDIYLTDWNIPGNMTVGGSFDMNGTLSASFNQLRKANVTVYSGSDAAGTPVTGGSDEVTDNVYPLAGSALAAATTFSALPAGTYLYEVSASYTNYYVAGDNVLAANEGTKILMQSGFTVTECAHSFTTSVTKSATCTEPGILERTCSKCGQVNRSTILATGHSYITETVAPTCTEIGWTIHTCTVCGDSYTENLAAALGHRYSAAYTAPTCTTAGKTAYTCVVCGDYYEEPIAATGHSYTDQVVAPGCETTGHTVHTCDVCGYSYNDSLTAATGHSYTAASVGATCTEAGGTKYTCTVCGDSFLENIVEAKGHSFVNGVCSACGAGDPTQEYYLFGFINGADYGCEGDYQNLGQYKFVNGKLTATFTQDSYVAVKAGDNLNWYMTDGWQGTAATSVVLYNTNTNITADKLYVPGGVEITFTLVNNGDGTLTLSYERTASVTQPVFQLRYPTLTFEDVITMNVYFEASNLEDVVEMGLITYKSQVTNYGVETAEAVIPGYYEASGMYVASTEGIPAKEMGDTYWFAVYAKLTDGSYAYTRLVSYSPAQYAYGQLSDPEMTKLVVAMLNYGAAAQTYFNYRTDSLMNKNLTAAQQASIETYRADMMDAVVNADSSKVGIFTNSGGFSRRYPTITFDGAFCIDYFFTPSNTPSGNVSLYYWTQDAYNAAGTLTPSNASGRLTMVPDGTGAYKTKIEGIAAKDLDKTIYVSAGYNSGGTSYCSGVLAYSIGAYCVSQAATTDPMSPFAQATAVYGYYAKELFY